MQPLLIKGSAPPSVPKGELECAKAPDTDVAITTFSSEILRLCASLIDYDAVTEPAMLHDMKNAGVLLKCLPAKFFRTAPVCVYVSLDRDIREMIEGVIESDLAAPKVPKERLPKLKRTWKCDHAHDFLYGHRAGYYKGLAEGIMIERHRRRLSDDEDDEVFQLTDRHAGNLRRYFAYYKERPRRRHAKK